MSGEDFVGAVGLIYVGAVLFINGLMLLGKVEPKAAAILNLFVGALQVVTPTVLIIQAGDDPAQILAASGRYLFGFTYLYVGINLLAGLDSTGVGYFSLFVAVMAVMYSFAAFRVQGDNPFGVIWLYWAYLWLLFFILLGLKRPSFTRYTGYLTAIQGWITAAIPAFLILSGYWENTDVIAWVLAVVGVVLAIGLAPLLRTGEPVTTQQRPPATSSDTRPVARPGGGVA
jgi:putative amide transporter protein